jgi:large subunit ribosomal protein L31
MRLAHFGGRNGRHCAWKPAGDPTYTQDISMKEGIHPDYREVVFQDLITGTKFVTRSTVQTRETIELDGKTYPLFKCDVTSESHPFYTGAQTRVVETGRVEKFRARFARTAGAKKAANAS